MLVPPEASASSRRRQWPWASVVVVAIALATATACGSDDDRSDPTPSEGDSGTSVTTTSPSTTTTSPETTLGSDPGDGPDEGDLLQAMEDLAREYHAVVADILADPRVASDRSHPATRRYLDLFTDGSEFAQAALENWESIGADGHVLVAGPSGVMHRTLVTAAEMTSDRDAEFSMCVLTSSQTVERDTGRVISAEGGIIEVRGTVVHQDDKWLLQRLDRLSSADCPEPGDFP